MESFWLFERIDSFPQEMFEISQSTFASVSFGGQNEAIPVGAHAQRFGVEKKYNSYEAHRLGNKPSIEMM